MQIEVRNINAPIQGAAFVVHGELDYEDAIERDLHLQFLREHLPPSLNPTESSIHRFQIGSSRIIIWNFSLFPLKIDRYGFLSVGDKYFNRENNEIENCHILLLLNHSDNSSLEYWMKKDHSSEVEKTLYKYTGYSWEKTSEPPSIVGGFYDEFPPQR